MSASFGETEHRENAISTHVMANSYDDQQATVTSMSHWQGLDLS
jgi:hypothetical protein